MLRFRELLHAWPLCVAVLLTPFQTEVLIATASTWGPRLGVDSFGSFGVVALLGTAKLYWGYWLWRWIIRLIADTERFHRLTGLVRQAAALIRAEGLSDRFFAELKICHRPDEWRQHRILKSARRVGYVILFGLGIAPVWGTRGSIEPVLAVASWRNGVHALALGNVIRIAYLMGGIELLQWLYAS